MTLSKLNSSFSLVKPLCSIDVRDDNNNHNKRYSGNEIDYLLRRCLEQHKVLFNLIDDLSTHCVIDPTYGYLEHEQRICAIGKSHSK